MKTIRAKVNKKTGEVTIATEGFDGATCLDATKKLEDGLGISNPERTLTPEYYNETQQQQENQA